MSITAGSTARGLPYPGHALAADVPTHIKALADAIETMNNSALVLGSTLSTTKLTISGATGQVEARAQNATGNVVFAAKRTADTTDLLQILANGTVKVSGGSGSLATAMVPGATGAVDFPNGFTGRRVDSPYFRAYRSTAASYATGAPVIFNTETDPNGWYDPATGIFLPTVAGMYRIVARVQANVVLTADNYIRVSSSGHPTINPEGPTTFQRTGSGQLISSLASALVPFNGTTDSIAITLVHNQGGTLAVSNGIAATYFEAERIGA